MTSVSLLNVIMLIVPMLTVTKSYAEFQYSKRYYADRCTDTERESLC